MGVVPVHTMNACKGVEVLTPLILNLSTRWMCGQLHTLATLSPVYTEKKEAKWAPITGMDSSENKDMYFPCY
jgi:hypothetical protein